MKSEFTARNKNEWLMCDSIFLTLIEFSAAIIHHKNIVENNNNEKKKDYFICKQYGIYHFATRQW